MNILTRSRDGVSILEVMVASAILAVAFSALYLLLGQGLTILKATNQAAVAQTILLARADRLREMGWSKLINSSTTSGVVAVLATNDPTTRYRQTYFSNSTERISAFAYSPPGLSGSSATYLITGSTSAAPAITPSTFTTGTNTSLKFMIHLDWTDSQSRVHTREISTVINKSGSP